MQVCESIQEPCTRIIFHHKIDSHAKSQLVKVVNNLERIHCTQSAENPAARRLILRVPDSGGAVSR